jgi:hypothetical protein
MHPVVTALMAKRPAAEKSSDGGGQKPEKKAGLKVAPEDAQLVNLIATHRAVSVEKLFKMKDVQDFFKHLLKVEMQKKTADLEGR